MNGNEPPRYPGCFITLEGLEGVGKSTQAQFVADWFRKAGKPVVLTREPGGTYVGDSVRTILLDHTHVQMAYDTELLLMFAARAEHLDKVIKPALDVGKFVICDRFTDSTYAYQGGGRKIAISRIEMLVAFVHGAFRPDLTLLLDAPPEIALARAEKRSTPDRFEGEDRRFFRSVRECYLALAKAHPERFRVIDASLPVERVQAHIRRELQALCRHRSENACS